VISVHCSPVKRRRPPRSTVSSSDDEGRKEGREKKGSSI